MQNIIWNTKIINETLENLRFGADVNTSCFHERNPELKADNILFQLTAEEEQEFIKCTEDIEFFVENYCKFLTDKGRSTVELREYQRDILNTIGEEVWLPNIEEFGPKVRNFIVMASRQTGKCFLSDTQIDIKVNSAKDLIKISIGDLYNIVNKQNKSFLKSTISKFKSFLYKIYHKL